MSMKVLRSIICTMALCVAANAAAANIAVTRFDDPIPDGCQVSDCSLREAVILANALFGPDTIQLGAGIYQLTIAGADEDLSATGDLDVLDDLSILGSGQDQTSIVMTAQLDRVIHEVHETDVGIAHHMILNDLSMSGGRVHVGGGFGPEGQGGCVLALGDADLRNVTIGNCEADEGGGLYLNFRTRATLQNVTVATNVAARFAGGAEISSPNGSISIHGLFVIDNEVTEIDTTYPRRAGGLYLVLQQTATDIDGVELIGNAAQNCGGGVFALRGRSRLANIAATGNVAYESGGGLCLTPILHDLDADLRDFTIIENVSLQDGGGLFFNAGLLDSNQNFPVNMTLTLYNANIGANRAGGNTSAGNGGAIAFPQCAGCDNSLTRKLTIVNSNIHDNISRAHTSAGITTGGNGGAIYSELPLSIRNSTFYNNRADLYGGALHLVPSPSGPQPPSLVAASTFSANATTATSGATGGGAVYARETGLQLSNDTFDSNASFAGGTVYNRGAAIAISQSTLIKSVTNPPGAVGNLVGAYTSASTTTSTTFINSALVGTCSGVPPIAAIGNLEAGNGFTNSCNLSGSSTANLAVQQLDLGVLANNGGPTLTRMPGAASAMLGAAQANSCELTDQRGFVRTNLALCDVGAVQTQAIDDTIFRHGFEGD
jgi:hypothetical protein